MQLKFPFPSDREDTFENFLVDGANEAAASILRAFAEGRAGQPASMALHGGPGCGKTHALSAMGALIAEKEGEGSVLYLDGQSLVEKIGAIKKYEDLKKHLAAYESASYLAIDDLDAVEGDRKAEDQVFHLYNAVLEKNGRFAAALRKPPTSWKFADWLSTRLLWGHVVYLPPVGDEARVGVLQKMAADLRLTLPEDAAVWLITHLPRDPETQRKALEQIDRRSLTTGRKVSIHLIKQAVEYVHAQ